jgi:threonyl-tRNA synthetase
MQLSYIRSSCVFTVKDALGREFQCATIQLDFNLPRRFNLKYTTSDGSTAMPVMVHRAVLGSLERMLGILIEHTGGKFPLWLSPRHVAVCSVHRDFDEHAASVVASLKGNGIRAAVVGAADGGKRVTLSKAVRTAQQQRYNYICVVGEREAAARGVTVRRRDGTVRDGIVTTDTFTEELLAEIGERVDEQEGVLSPV